MNKKFHNKYCLHNNHIGILQTWGWKKEYIFLDFETGNVIQNVDPKNVKFVNKSEYDKRNYREPKTGETFNDRQKIYGKLHDTQLKLMMEDATDGEYSLDYCRGVAYMFSMYEYHQEMIGLYGKEYGTELIEKIATVPLELQEQVRKIALKHLLGSGSTYDKYCDRMGVMGKPNYVPEAEVIDMIQKFKNEGSLGESVLNSQAMQCPELQFLLKQLDRI